MSKKNKISVPNAGGGIFRVSDEEGKGLQLKPEYIIGFTAVVVVLEIILHFYGSAIF